MDPWKYGKRYKKTVEAETKTKRFMRSKNWHTDKYYIRKGRKSKTMIDPCFPTHSSQAIFRCLTLDSSPATPSYPQDSDRRDWVAFGGNQNGRRSWLKKHGQWAPPLQNRIKEIV
jgi:hypothetical protein